MKKRNYSFLKSYSLMKKRTYIFIPFYKPLLEPFWYDKINKSKALIPILSQPKPIVSCIHINH